MTWILLYFMVSGTSSLVVVHQPPVFAAALGNDVTMQCQLQLSHDEKMLTVPVLYWLRLTPGRENPRLWSPSASYEERVALLDKNPDSTNKSILLRNVQWADSGKYLCKLSITTEKHKSFRRTGNETLLIVHDTMNFNLTSHNDSLLRCEVNVSLQSGLVLSIFHDGCKAQPVDPAQGDADAALPFVTLSETISLNGSGKYECQLHLNEDLIMKSTFHYLPPVAVQGGDARKNLMTTRPTITSDVVVYPEPWLLYVSLLLVPITILLGLVTALLMYRS
ncbi:uncharacterized protein LOC111235729 [Seriola dumerili]|uniref:uncharacterized protein LOC111235729 n=1 Tax=Seriola dumerili TaxID=41447 RepID=UPI000BBF236C|nr:uncharacterized protein LOC111235729 [Seriola dumerili]